MIDQLSVMLANDKGRLTALTRLLGDNGVQMHALTVADTNEFGIVRIICDKPASAKSLLDEGGFQAAITRVCAVQVPNVPGGTAQVFEAIDNAGANVEYAYCFASADGAVLAIKASEDVASMLDAAGFGILHPEDLYEG